MLRSLKDLKGYVVSATDGDLGAINDFLLDDQEWAIRYVVANSSAWLPGRRVLVSPSSITNAHADWASRRVQVELTRQQVKNSPGIESDEPVSRQLERELSSYYRWPEYWLGPKGASAPVGAVNRGIAGTALADRPAPREPTGDPNLRSFKEVTGYHIVALDGEIGHVEDLVADDETWSIRYVVVDTRNWLPGRKVLVSPAWIRSIDWAGETVQVDLQCEQIKSSPEFNPSSPVNREYETRLYDYYGRPKYWQAS